MPIRQTNPGEFHILHYRFRVVPLGERVAVHCALFPTVVFSRPGAEAQDPAALVTAAAWAMVDGQYSELDLPRGMSWDGWQAAIAELRAALAEGSPEQ